MAECEKSHFDLGGVAAGFQLCKQDDETILVDPFLDAYQELCKFFGLFGTVFSFVMSDVQSKIEILQHHRCSDDGAKYESVQSMIAYEVENKLTDVPGKWKSGSRTLLRLHRALEFINELLRRIMAAQTTEKLVNPAWEAYNSTLAHYHPWLIRKGVGVALYALPTKAGLMAKVNETSEEKASEQVAETIESIQPVYNIVQKIYEEYNLLNLP